MVFHSFLEAYAILNPWVRPRPGLTSPPARREAAYRSLLASRSDSRRVRISPSLTGPLTLRMMRRFWSSRNLTRTWVTCPRDPVLPMTLTTIASFRGDSCGCDASRKKKKKKNTRVFVSGQVPPKRRSLRALRARRQEGSKCGGHNDDQPLGLRARDAGTAPSGVSLAFAPHQTPRTLVVSRTGREKTDGFRASLLKRSRRVAPRRRPSSPPTTATSLRLRGEQGSLPWLQ